MAREFCHDYIKMCEENKIEVQECVVAALQRCDCSQNVSGCSKCFRHCTSLKLSSCALLEKTCTILGRLLATDHSFADVSFADCTLPDRGLRDIFEGLALNTTCRSLDLKGNNIRAQGAEALGRMLRQNSSIQRLCLEWNCIGALEQSFAVFVDGLAANTSLMYIDLRNNQITHEGATELACALKRNLNLKQTDLRWNNIGLIGGRTLLEALQHGSTVEHLDLQGNNIPSELLMSIEGALSHNRQKSQLCDEYSRRTHSISAELKRTKREKALEVEDLASKLNEKEARMHQSTREACRKVSELQQTLDERTTTCNSILSKVALLESELTLAEKKLKDTEILLRREREDRELLFRHTQSEAQHVKEETTSYKEKMQRELAEVNDRSKEQERTIVELQLKCQQLQSQLHEAREEIAHLHADKKMQKVHSDELLQIEKQAHAQRLAELTERKNKEIEQITNDCTQKEQALQDHVSKLSRRHLEYQQEISNLKTAITKEKLTAEEELSAYKQRALADQNVVIRTLEDRVHSTIMAKDELQSQYSKLNLTVIEVQSRNNNLLSDLEAANRKIQGLELELSNRRGQTQLEVEKARQEMAAKVVEAEAEAKRNADEVATQTKKLQIRLEAMSEECTEAMKGKEVEIKKLRERIAFLDGVISSMQEESAQRATALQSAVRTFAQPLSSGSASPGSTMR